MTTAKNPDIRSYIRLPDPPEREPDDMTSFDQLSGNDNAYLLRPRCPSYSRGYAELNTETKTVECSNPHCNKPAEICPKCNQGLLLLRTGQSRFWGCSRYQATPSCSYTRPAPGPNGNEPGAGSQPLTRRRGWRRVRYTSQR